MISTSFVRYTWSSASKLLWVSQKAPLVIVRLSQLLFVTITLSLYSIPESISHEVLYFTTVSIVFWDPLFILSPSQEARTREVADTQSPTASVLWTEFAISYFCRHLFSLEWLPYYRYLLQVYRYPILIQI